MKMHSWALSFVLAAPAFSQVSLPEVGVPGDIAAATRPALERAVRATVLDASWLVTDAAFAHASDVDIRVNRFGDHAIARVTPIVRGVRVVGADRVLVLRDDGVRTVDGVGRSLTPTTSFSLPAHEAMLAATTYIKHGVFVDVTVERIDGLAVQVWLTVPNGLRPTWKVRVPTLRLEDLKDVYVDGASGEIIKAEPVARFQATPAAADVFEYSPNGAGLNVADLKRVELSGLRPGLVEGDALRGDHFNTANCCKMVVCNDNGTDCLQNLPAGTVASDVARCATQDDIDDGIAVESVVQPPQGIPSSTLPIPAQFASFVPDPLFVKIAFCAEIPRASLLPADGDRPAGWFFDPVDANARAGRRPCYAPSSDARPADGPGCASEEEPFAEVQVYHATSVFFAHVRDVLDDQTFCLGGQSQQCDATGAPVLDNGEPARAFHIATNVMFPNIDFNALLGQIAPPPIGQGKGANAGNPVVIEDFQRLANAAFVPALEGGPIQIPPELQALAALFNRPFDSNIYFQGERDFAYDGDVVRHEFTHAVVHSFVPGLGSLGKDKFGGHAESGGLNEGWADYFSSSFSDESNVGDYAAVGLGAGGETGLRNNDNDKACPDDMLGEVHSDSEHWAGALWAIREQHKAASGDIDVLDRALLSALAQADNDEDMTRAAVRAEAAIRSAVGASLADFAKAEFEARGVSNCFRVWPLATLNAEGTDVVVTRKDLLLQPGKGDIGTANFAPSVLQFRVDVPAGAAGFTLTWQQAAGGGLGGLGGGGGAANMAVAVIEVPTDAADAAIEWRYEGNNGTLAVPYDHTGTAANFNETASAVTLGTANQQTGAQSATFTHTIDSDACNARSFVFSIVALDGGATMQNIDVDLLTADGECNPGEGEGEGEGEPPDGCPCSGGTTRPSSLMLFAVGLALLRFRRKR